MTSANRATNPNAAQITHAGAIFEQVATGLVARVRTAMAIPEAADDATEAEFAALQQRLECFRPEFERMFGKVLGEQLGEHADQILADLQRPAPQAYFKASSAIREEVTQKLDELSQSMLRQLNP